MGEDAEKAAAFVDDFKSFDLKQDYPIGVDITPSEVMTLRTMFGDTADPVKVEEAIANGGAGFPDFLATIMATQIGAKRTAYRTALTNASK